MLDAVRQKCKAGSCWKLDSSLLTQAIRALFPEVYITIGQPPPLTTLALQRWYWLLHSHTHSMLLTPNMSQLLTELRYSVLGVYCAVYWCCVGHWRPYTLWFTFNLHVYTGAQWHCNLVFVWYVGLVKYKVDKPDSLVSYRPCLTWWTSMSL